MYNHIFHPYITVYELYSMSNLCHILFYIHPLIYYVFQVSGSHQLLVEIVHLLVIFSTLTDDTFILFHGRTHDAKTNATYIGRCTKSTTVRMLWVWLNA